MLENIGTGGILFAIFFLGLLLAVKVWVLPVLRRMFGGQGTSEERSKQLSPKDRELLDLIYDLAKMYHSTGR